MPFSSYDDDDDIFMIGSIKKKRGLVREIGIGDNALDSAFRNKIRCIC